MFERFSIDTSRPLSILLVSDIHAFDTLAPNEPEPSYVKVLERSRPNPVSDLVALAAKGNLDFDFVVSCGDMTDKGRPSPAQWAWQQLHSLAGHGRLGLLLATAGNHDLDSRWAYSRYDARGHLQELEPVFPLDDATYADRYWSRHFVLLQHGLALRLVLLNSAAFHGYGSDRAPEYRHGRVSPSTLRWLRKALIDAQQAHGGDPVRNLLVLHHHPHRHEDIEADDYSALEDAHELLKLLGDGEFGKWLVVHGHKHQPRIAYAQGCLSAPVVLGCGSLGAILYPAIQSLVRNQFHILRIPFDSDPRFVGTVESWDWSYGVGWKPAGDGSGLPAITGFGYRGEVESLAKAVIGRLLAAAGDHVEWSALKAAVPDLSYIFPRDLDSLLRQLGRAGVKMWPPERPQMLKLERPDDSSHS